MKTQIEGFRDLEVYQKLVELHLAVNEITLRFPKYELYELESQLRRATNSIPANLAEGWNNKHVKIYLEGINRGLGELRETEHHLYIAHRKGYLSETEYQGFLDRYEKCGRMLRGLERSLIRSHSRP